MKRKIKNISIIIFLSCILLSVFTVDSNGFLADDIAASVDNTPITLNDLYFLYNFNMVNNLKYYKINGTIPNIELKRALNIYINRILILKEEEKTGGRTISKHTINLLAAGFKKKFEILHKRINFISFLKKFGFDKNSFYIFLKNILVEKEFVSDRLKFFLFALRGNAKISQNSKQKYGKELSAKLKHMMFNIKMHAKIEINGNFN